MLTISGSLRENRVLRKAQSRNAVKSTPWNSYRLTITGDSVLIVFNVNLRLRYVIKLKKKIKMKKYFRSDVYDVHGFSEISSKVPITFQIIAMCRQFDRMILSSLKPVFESVWRFVSTVAIPEHEAAIKQLIIPIKSFNMLLSAKVRRELTVTDANRQILGFCDWV